MSTLFYCGRRFVMDAAPMVRIIGVPPWI